MRQRARRAALCRADGGRSDVASTGCSHGPSRLGKGGPSGHDVVDEDARGARDQWQPARSNGHGLLEVGGSTRSVKAGLVGEPATMVQGTDRVHLGSGESSAGALHQRHQRGVATTSTGRC
jgi:hypothetical protein